MVAVVVQRYNGSEAYREDKSSIQPRFQPKSPTRNLQKNQQTMKHEHETLSILLNDILIFKMHMPEYIYFISKLSKTLCVYSLIPALIKFAMS